MTRMGSMVSAAAMFGLVAASAVQAQTPTPTTATSTCVGDCKDKMMVDIADLIVGVNIALGVQELAMCPAFDCMHDGTVTVTCLVQGVNNALLGCVRATATATPPGGVPTATATPTTNAGKVRVFTIGHLVDDVTGMALTTDDTAGSGLFNLNLLGHGNVATMISSGPLTLVLGAPDANGVAPLALQSDVTISVDITLNSSCSCLKFLAQGSTGSVSCNGGTAYDTTVTQDTNSVPETAWTIQTRQGTAAGPGNGDLVVTGLFQDFPGSCATVDCEHVTYANPANQFAFTTTKSTTVKKGAGAGPFTTTAGGSGMSAPFDCANFGTPGSGGVLVSGVAMTDPQGGATADSLRFSE